MKGRRKRKRERERKGSNREKVPYLHHQPPLLLGTGKVDTALNDTTTMTITTDAKAFCCNCLIDKESVAGRKRFQHSLNDVISIRVSAKFGATFGQLLYNEAYGTVVLALLNLHQKILQGRGVGLADQ